MEFLAAGSLATLAVATGGAQGTAPAVAPPHAGAGRRPEYLGRASRKVSEKVRGG
jgi:hypothetical protein